MDGQNMNENQQTQNQASSDIQSQVTPNIMNQQQNQQVYGQQIYQQPSQPYSQQTYPQPNQQYGQQIYQQAPQPYNQTNTQQQGQTVYGQPLQQVPNQNQQYYQPQQGQPYYQQPYAPKKSNGKAIASLVLSIVSLVCIFFSWTAFMGLVGIITGIIGLVLGIVANKHQKSGMGTAGIVMSCVGLGICALEMIACFACVSACGSLGSGAFGELYDELEGLDAFEGLY